MTIPNEFKAFIFDVDGTLADTEEGHRTAFNRVFAERGLDWDWTPELYRKLLTVTGGKERIRHFLREYRPEEKLPEDVDGFIAGLHQGKTAHYVALLREGGIPLRPGVARLLGEAREAGIRLAIATTTTMENVTTLLECTLGRESIDWFEVIGAGGVVPSKKPAPDIYVYVLEQLGLTADQCLAFEDSQNGIRAATAAGLRCVITVCQYTDGEDFQGALIELDQLGEPDAPCTPRGGKTLPQGYVDLAGLRALRTT